MVTALRTSTHGTLRRYVLTFPSTREAENFHQSIAYVYAKDPVRLSDIKRTYDGRTVIVHAFSRYWDKKSMAKEASIRGGRLTGYGTVLSTPKRDPQRTRSGTEPSRRPHHAWELWTRGDRYDEPMFISAFKDKGEAEERMRRLKRSHPGTHYMLKHRRVPAQMLFGSRGRRRATGRAIV